MKSQIEASQVARVYNGRPGCCCGCKGKYVEVNGEHRRSVNYVLNVINRNLEQAEDLGTCISLEKENRLYIAYYKEDK